MASPTDLPIDPPEDEFEQALFDLFLDHNKDALITRFILLSDTSDLPLEDMLLILEETTDLEIQGAILTLFEKHFMDIHKQLILYGNTTTSMMMRFHILNLCCEHLMPTTLHFVFSQYLKTPKFREFIETKLEKRPDALLLALTPFIQSTPLSKQDETTIKHLLAKVPKTTYVKHAPDLKFMKISALYHSL